MDKIARLRQEIEQLRREVDDHNYYLDNSEQAVGYSNALDDIEKFLDTLSEEPSKSLQEEIETWIPAHISIRTDETLPINPTEIANACKEWGKCVARHFAKWQKSQMLKDAIYYVVQDDLDSHGASYNIPFIRIGTTALKPKGIGVGDKVKVIVLKEEEE